MPKILESEALTIARSIDQAPETDRPWMLDLLNRYQQQQRDEGEPDWPSVERARVERETNLRGMFESPEKITYDPGPFSQNPQEAKMIHANMALLSARYQKEPAEVASRYDFLLNDYARQKLGASEDVDTAKFYALAQKDMQKVKLREDTQREGMSAALRGEDGVKALSAWQAKNADRAKDDAGLFMRGYQQALEQDGEMLPIADRLWKALESGTDKTGQNVQANMERGQVRQELGQMVEQLAGMKKAQRKSVYRSIAARIQAAGYDQKGFWSQMLGFLDQQLYAADSSLTETGGIAVDASIALAQASGRSVDMLDGTPIATPVLSAEQQQALLRQRDYRERIGDVEGEIMQIVSGELDPVKPTTGWMNETVEIGLIKAPGAILPSMGASALLGPYGAGLLFTADFAANNRRELVQSGLDADQARKVAVMAAPLQAAVESLSNMVSLGKFPAVQAALSRFTRPVGGASLVGRYVQNSLISGATEFIEEQVQDNVVVPAMQELLGALEKDVPEVDWSFYKTRAANATPELAATLLPMALVFGGVMTAADAKLSRTMTQNADLMMATGMDQAQAVEIASQPTHEQRIKKGAELWLQRKGTKASMEEAQKKLADQYRTLAADSAAAVKELEARGVLPRLLPMQGGEYRLTFNDGSTADFKTREEALGGIHVYIRDRMQRSTRALRETIDTLTKNLEQGREFALEISPEAMPADEAVKRGIISPQALQERAAQGAILDATTLIENSVLTGKALGDEETPLMLFGMSKNEWYDKEGRAIGMQRIKDDILRTTMRLWDGASPLTLIEEKTEGDAKVILSTPGKRQWMLDHLRAYEDASGDKLFTSDDNEQINDKQLIEAWSHMAQSYFVAAKDKVKGRTLGRYLRDIEEAELTAAMQGRASWWQAVVNRAQKLGELKAAGKLGADVVAELEKQLGIDSQVKHEQEAMQEAQNVANEVAQQASDWVDDSQFDNLPPSNDTFSMASASGAAQANEPSPGGLSEAEVKDILADVDRERRRLEKQTGLDDEGEREEMGREKVSEYEDFVQERVLQEAVELTLRKLGARSEGRSNKSEASYWSIPSLPTPEYDAEGYVTNSDEWRIRVASHDAVYAISDTKIKIDLRELADPEHAILESVSVFNRLQKQIAAALANDGDVTQEQNNPATTVSGMDTRLQRESPPSSPQVNPESSRAAGGTQETFAARRAIPADASKVVQMPDGARLVGPTTFSIRAFHGTPHKVDKFRTDKIGTGEGAQAYGWGLYFAESREVGEGYRDKLAQWTLLTSDGKIYDDRKELKNLNVRAVLNKNGSIEEAIARAKSVIESIPGTQGAELALADISTLEELKGRGGLTKTKGNLYTVELLPDADEFLDWDKPLSEQSEKVKAAIASAEWDGPKDRYENGKFIGDVENALAYSKRRGEAMNGADLYAVIVSALRPKAGAGIAEMQKASQKLASLGIPGIRYLDQGSRGAGDGTRNYVIFDENLVRILEENGKPVAQDTFSLAPRITPAQDADYLAAVKAGDMETAQRLVDSVRLKPREVFYVGNTEVVRNPNDGDYRQIKREHQKEYPNDKMGETTRFTTDKNGNRYIWRADYGMHSMIEPGIEAREKVAVGQNEFNWNRKSADPVTRDESGNVIPLSQRFNPADDRITYSLRPGDFASRVEAMFSPFQRSPEARLIMTRIAKSRALKLGQQVFEASIRTIGSIDREARVRAALAEDKAVQDYLDGLTPAARQTLEWQPADLQDDPLVAAMLDFGKLDLKMGDFDGAPWLPPSFYSKGAGIMPDQMAQAMFDAGLLPDAYTDTLWAELSKRIEATRKDKAAHREAVQAFKDAKKAARDAAAKEAGTWADNAKKQAGSGKAQRDRIKAWLRVLDGILAASPPEVRARVGGFVKMAGIATDEAALRYLEDRVAKLDKELEKWLKKDATGSINRLFKRAAADYTAGKKAKGKLGPDEHYLFQRAEAASEMDAPTLRGQLANLDVLADDESLSDDQRALAVLERGIVELVGDMKNADSGRLFTAFDELSRLYSQGVVAWKAKQTARREARQAVRDALKADAGKSGVLKERQAMEKAMTTLFGKAKSAWLSVSSFSEVLRYAFGSKSQQATELIDGEREASNAYEDEQQAIADELESLFTSMAGGKVLDGERLRFDMAKRTIKAGDVELSQFEAITALLMWRQEDGRRHMEGTFDENGQRTSGWSYDQAWIDEVEKQLTPEGRRVMAWLAAKYGSEHGELNALYRERHGVNLPAHDNYAPITVKPMQAKAGEIVDPVSGAAVSGSILTPGSLRTRSRMAVAEPEFRDALQTFVGHKKQMGYWKAYYDLATDMQAVLGNRELMNSVEAAVGSEAVTVLGKWVTVLAQGGVRDAAAGLAMNGMFQRMMNRAATVGLLGRVSTLLVQSTQLAAASVQMPVGAYLRRFGKLFGGQLDWKGAIQSAFIQRRIKTAPPIVRQAFENLANAKSPNEIKRATYNLGKLLSGTDGLFTGGTYAILLDYHRETGRKLGLTGADLEEHAHREAERATEEVAQPTRTATRSLAELTATNPLAKVSFAYASEARQKIALLGWAAVNFKADPVRFGKAAFLVFGVGGVMSQVLKNIWKEAKGDDDEEKWSPERLIKGSVVNALHGIPMMAEIMGEPGMFSSTAWAQAALDDLLKGEADLRDINTLLGTLGLFNDTAAGIAAMSNAGYDFAKIIEAAFSE